MKGNDYMRQTKSVSEQESPVIMLFIVFLQHQVTAGMFTAPDLYHGLE